MKPFLQVLAGAVLIGALIGLVAFLGPDEAVPGDVGGQRVESPTSDSLTQGIESKGSENDAPNAARAESSAPASARSTNPVSNGRKASPSIVVAGRFELAGHRFAGSRVLQRSEDEPRDDLGVFLLEVEGFPYPVRLERWEDSGGRVREQMHVANHTVVRFREGSVPPEILKQVGPGQLFERIEALSVDLGIYRLVHGELQLNAAIELPPVLAARFAELIQYAEPDPVVHPGVAPNDPGYLSGELWGLNNLGQDGGTFDADIDAPEGWDIRRNASAVIVGVVDSGILYTHEDLAENMWTNLGEIAGNGIDDDSNGYIDDIHGINAITNTGDPKDDNSHGSHVAGTIGGRGDNGLGVSGVAWEVKLMGLKFLSASGSGATSDAIKCLDYARTMGAHITNNSWGGGSASLALEDAIQANAAADMLFVVAAGNDGKDNDSGATFPSSYGIANIVSVAASTRSDDLASFSNFGFGTVHLAAPGAEIWSVGIEDDRDYSYKSGTSMASPHVAGALALLRAQYPDAPAGELINRLNRGADLFSAADGQIQTGRRLNLLGALTTTDTRPLNDDFSEATEIPTPNAVTQVTLYGATPESSNLSDGIADGQTVWWRITFPVGGPVVVDLSGSDFDTLLGVYTGSSVGALTSIETDDDSGEGTSSYLEFTAVAGTEYYIGVAGKNGEEGYLAMSLGGPPENDNLANATDMQSKAPVAIEQYNKNTSKEAGEPDHAGNSGGRSLWFKWTAPATRTYTLTTGGANSFSGGSDIDTLLAVYSGPASSPTHASLTSVASNDDAPEGGAFSTLTFGATAGTTYYFAVDGKNGAVGFIRIALFETPVNDGFANAIPLAGDLIQTSGNLLGATVEPGEPNHAGENARHTVWYDWTPDTSGDYAIDTIYSGGVSSSMETLLAIYTGSSLGGLIEVASDGNGSGGGDAALVTLSATGGTTYRIAVGLNSGVTAPILGPFGLNIREVVIPANDDFADAVSFSTPALPESPVTLLGNNLGAGLESGEPAVSNNFHSTNTVWWKWRATVSARMQFDTEGSDFDTYLQLFTGSSVDSLTLVGADDDSGSGRTSRLDWEATSGTTYYVRVSGYNNASGQISLTLDYYEPNPQDAFADGLSVTPGFIYKAYESTGATTEPGEPNHAGVSTAGRSIWFRFTPDASNAGEVTFSSQGSWNDTVVAVYTGSSVGALTEIVSNDQYGGRNDGQVTWNAQLGTTYHIAVATADPGVTSLVEDYWISFLATPNDDLANATGLLGDQHSVDTHNFGATKESGEDNHAGNGGGRSIWFDWTPGSTGTFRITTEGSYERWQHFSPPTKVLDTLLAVYTGSAVDGLSLVGQNDDANPVGKGETSGTSTVFVDATAGTTYRIAIDGYRDDGEADWGSIQLDIAPFSAPANDELSGALPLTDSFNHIFADNAGTGVSPGEPTHGGNATRSQHTLWYRFTAPESKDYHVSAAGNFYNDARATGTVVAVYMSALSEPGYGDLAPVVSDASDSAYLTTHATFSATAGTTYYVALGSSQTGPTSLILAEAPANDSVADAANAYGSSFTVTGYNVGAQAEPDEVSPESWQAGRSTGWRSVWWRWTAPATGNIEIETYDSDLWVLLSVYEDASDAASLTAPLYSADGIDGINVTVTGEKDFNDRRRRGTVATSLSVTAGQTYLFRVSGTGPSADHVGTINLKVSGPLAAPPAPQDFSASRISANRVDLSWSDVSDDEESFTIQRAFDPGGPWTEVVVVDEDGTAYADTAAPAGDLVYRIRASNAAGESAWTEFTLVTPQLPTVPADLTATALDATSIRLTWTHSHSLAESETGFEIQRSLDGTESGFSTVGASAANATEWTDSGLSPGVEYVYRIRSVNTVGESGWSFYAFATTWHEETLIDSPTSGYFISNTGSSSSASLTNTGGTVLRHFTGGSGSGSDDYSAVWRYFPQVSLADGESLALEVNFALVGTPPNIGQTLRFGLFDSNGSKIEADIGGNNNPAHRDDDGYGFMLATGTNTTSRYRDEDPSATSYAPLILDSSILGADPQTLGVNDNNPHTIRVEYTRVGGSLQFDVYVDGQLYDGGRSITSPHSFDFDMLWLMHRMENHSWDLNSVSVVHNRVSEVLTSAERWRQEHFGQTTDSGEASDTANPDGDSYSNLLERALGLDPQIWNSSSPLTLQREMIGGLEYWTIELTRNPMAQDLDYVIETSTDLIDWTTEQTVVLTDSGEILKSRSPQHTEVEERRFFRLKITNE